ncbi:hypothetical protein WL95_10105 [Burkholderia cepacia]|nr:hypothetical protein WL95_10105 [Burkholderia cepacia]
MSAMMMDGIAAAAQQAARRKTGREYTAGAGVRAQGPKGSRAEGLKGSRAQGLKGAIARQPVVHH